MLLYDGDDRGDGAPPHIKTQTHTHTHTPTAQLVYDGDGDGALLHTNSQTNL